MSKRPAPLPPADDELWSLVEALVEGSATAAERDRLEARLRAEPAARSFYVAFLDLHAHLQWRTRGEASPTRSAELGARNAARAPRWRRAAFAASLALAAGLLVAFFVWRHGPEEGEFADLPDAPAGSVAVLIDNSNTVWEKDTDLPTGTGSALPPGRLKLRAGVVEIAFHNGGEVLLEGPADFEVSAADGAFLHRGKLTARVPEGAPAFRVGMPGVVVTDRGGECGLLRDETGRTEVHVFEGEVGASATDGEGDPLPGMRLAEKAGARVDASRRTLTPVPLDEQVFAHLRPEIRVADASVRGGQFAGRNFGTVPQLMVKNSIADYCWDTYLRFDLSGVKGTVRAASVRLVPLRVGRPFDNAAALVPDGRWSETAVTWDSKPSSKPAFARWTVREGEPVEFDVTLLVRAALAGDKRLSLRIFAPAYQRGSAFVQYGSRRGDAEARPQLLLTIEP
jgi:ferric-dicitrate binding protein FerR (iron transport regulator)